MKKLLVHCGWQKQTILVAIPKDVHAAKPNVDCSLACHGGHNGGDLCIQTQCKVNKKLGNNIEVTMSALVKYAENTKKSAL